MSVKWFVVYSHPHKESIAAVNITRQGFETYVPCYKRMVKHARKISIIAAPLFPRYFFVKLDQEANNWHSLNNTCGVSYLLKNKNGNLLSIKDSIIKELFNNHDQDGLVSLSVLELFKPGDKVRILNGAFNNHIAIYQRMTDSQRVELLINLIQQEVALTMPLYAVEKI